MMSGTCWRSWNISLQIRGNNCSQGPHKECLGDCPRQKLDWRRDRGEEVESVNLPIFFFWDVCCKEKTRSWWLEKVMTVCCLTFPFCASQDGFLYQVAVANWSLGELPFFPFLQIDFRWTDFRETDFQQIDLEPNSEVHVNQTINSWVLSTCQAPCRLFCVMSLMLYRSQESGGVLVSIY